MVAPSASAANASIPFNAANINANLTDSLETTLA